MTAAEDPWTASPPPTAAGTPRLLVTTALADVATLDVERITSPKALPLHAGMLCAIVGPSEVGKTTLAVHAVLDIAAGGRAAIVFDGEMSAPSWRRKLVEIGATDEDLARVHYAEMSIDSVNVDLVRAAVRTLSARLIVWDSALSLISRTAKSENDNVEVGKVFDRLRSIIRDGPAGLIIDHSPKDSANRVSRGASAKFAALDVSYGVRLVDGCVPGPFETWSTIVSVEKDRHALLGTRADREVTYCPLGHGQLDVSVAELGTSTHRLSATNPVTDLVRQIAELDPPPKSANDAFRRVTGRRSAVQSAYKIWQEQTR